MAKRVFSSFYFQNLRNFRVNVVRNHCLTKRDRDVAGFFDISIWETAKRTSDIALKNQLKKSVARKLKEEYKILASKDYSVNVDQFRSLNRNN